MYLVYITYVTPEDFMVRKNDAVTWGDHMEIMFDAYHSRKIDKYAIVFAALTV
jgi:hypothetical protein